GIDGCAKADSPQKGGAGGRVSSRNAWYSWRVTGVLARRNGASHTSWRGFSLSRGPPPIQNQPPGTLIHSGVIQADQTAKARPRRHPRHAAGPRIPRPAPADDARPDTARFRRGATARPTPAQAGASLRGAPHEPSLGTSIIPAMAWYREWFGEEY